MNPLRRLYRRSLKTGTRVLNSVGLNFSRSSDFYSPLPLISSLARNRRRWDRASPMVGIDYDLDSMRELLSRLVDRYAGEAARPDFATAKTLSCGAGFTEVDALTLYLMVRHLRPNNYIEIGAGLSTYFAWAAVEQNRREDGRACTMTCIDPYARPALEQLDGLEIVRQPVQAVDLDTYDALGSSDILFIDSTHVVKIDGDVPHLYLEILPRLAAGVTIHSHDIHFPYNVPHPAEQYLFEAKWPMFWTEPMLLQAFLSFNPSFEIVLSTPLLRFEDESFLELTIPDYRKLEVSDYDTHHSSLWYRRIAADR